MALYHVHADVIQKGQSVGGATGFARYIAREDADNATQFVRYLDPEHGREDLVAKGYGGMPAWATTDRDFWRAADRYERGGATRPGTVARTYEMALPRELSPEARLELAADIRATFFEQYPHSWAIHNPIDRQGQEHPHMHLMLSERRPTDESIRSPKRYFSQAAGPHQDPASHGVRKDRSWQGPTRLRDLRAGIATLTNAALDRAGIDAAVSHHSLWARGYRRAVDRYTERDRYARDEEKTAVETKREGLHWETHPWEQSLALGAWQQQKVREQIVDISREAMVDHVRDRFWRKDTSPAREQERQASGWRSIQREHVRTGRPFQGPQSRQPVDLRQVAASLRRMQQRLAEHEQVGSALRVRLWEEDERQREHARGIGW